MTAHSRELMTGAEAGSETPAESGGWLAWPRSAWLAGAGLLLLYGPGLADTARLWFKDETYAHGVFVFPLVAFLLYTQRDAIRKATPKPTAWGLLPLALSLLIQVVCYALQIRSLEMWSLVSAIMGCILLLHGAELWRITLFPVLYLLFAMPMPIPLLDRTSRWIQSVSTTGAVWLMQGLGYTISQTGNQIEIPGYALEVAKVCSGFKKLIALGAFSLLYGYMFAISPWRRAALAAAAIPVAALANVLRISGLIAVTSAGGLPALSLAHDWGEIVALLLAFGMFVLIGKWVGCKSLRFIQPSASA